MRHACWPYSHKMFGWKCFLTNIFVFLLTQRYFLTVWSHINNVVTMSWVDDDPFEINQKKRTTEKYRWWVVFIFFMSIIWDCCFMSVVNNTACNTLLFSHLLKKKAQLVLVFFSYNYRNKDYLPHCIIYVARNHF